MIALQSMEEAFDEVFSDNNYSNSKVKPRSDEAIRELLRDLSEGEKKESKNKEEKVNKQPRKLPKKIILISKYDEEKVRDELKKLREKIKKRLNIEKSTLLTDEIIEILVKKRVNSREKFLMNVPLYLREKIDLKEADYLNEVFKIVGTDE
jgi:hypothetical protein